MIDQTYTQWLSALASPSPTPGGGGAAALMGAIGVSLGAMVGSLTAGKKKYVDVEEEILQLTAQAKALSEKLQSMIEADAQAFLPLSDAYRMAADTPAGAAQKEEALQAALLGATEVPLAIAELCVEAAKLLQQFADKGSRLALSDAGCGAACCLAALESAKLNVYINLRLMKDEEKKQGYLRRLSKALQTGRQLTNAVSEAVERELMP